MNRFQTWYRGQPQALRAILTINVVLYVAWLVVFIHIGPVRDFVYRHLALNPGMPGIFFEPWQLITYSFLHLGTGLGGLLHIGFNMLWLFWIGKEYEELHGSHRMMSAYLFGGLGGGLLTVLLHAIFPSAGLFAATVYGASGSVFGVMMVVATTYPYKSIALLFIGTVRIIYIVAGLLALDILFLAGGSTSISAHVGGVLFGFLFAKAEMNGRDLSGWAQIFFRRGDRRRRARRQAEEGSILGELESWLSSRRGGGRSGAREEGPRPTNGPYRTRERAEEVTETVTDPLENEIDRILDKISEVGIEGLTDQERRILDQASRR